MAFSAVLTDLDGTLIHSQDAICDALFVSFAAVKAVVPEKQKILDMFGLPVEEMLIKLGGIDRNDVDRIHSFISSYKANYPVFMKTGAKVIVHAHETMDSIYQMGFPICLVTSERKSNAEYILSRTGLDSAIKHIISRDDVTKFKPDPEPINLAANAVGKNVQDCVYIGESPFDIQAGKAAEAYVAAVGSGNWSVDSLIACQPDVLLDDISELLSVIEQSLTKK